MSNLSPKRAAVLITVLLGLTALSAEVIDRVIATVNNVPLLQSDLEDSVRVEAFLQQRALHSISVADRSAALSRLVDQELLRQQMQSEFEIKDSEIDTQIATIREQCNTAGNDAEWRKLLDSYGLDEPLLRDRLGAQLTALRFVDLRLRPTVHIDHDAVEAYYRETLVPKLQQMGAKIDPLSEVAPKIEELLAQRRMDELLNAWLSNLRSQSIIHIAHQPQQDSRAAIPAVSPSQATFGGR
jgi:hypothetical protein